MAISYTWRLESNAYSSVLRHLVYTWQAGCKLPSAHKFNLLFIRFKLLKILYYNIKNIWCEIGFHFAKTAQAICKKFSKNVISPCEFVRQITAWLLNPGGCFLYGILWSGACAEKPRSKAAALTAMDISGSELHTSELRLLAACN